ncbi:hypothetical protein [Streptomyces sp. NPDC102360]|uniref:hypothetical protein n=1 Tax=Streptomyces sp. NPDC102360 TaxID=3366160 RepID=UPI0038227D7C
MTDSLITRRTLIGAAAATGAFALAGCGKGNNAGGNGKKRPSSGAPSTDATRLGELPPAADTASARSTGGAWRYTHLSSEQGASYQALSVTSRDDLWLLGTRTQSFTPFLEYWDGKRWSEPAMPGELIAGGRRSLWALAAGASGQLWLAQRTVDHEQLAVFHRKDGAWQRLPDPPAVEGNHMSGGATQGAWCVASGAHVWVVVHGEIVHWNGERWDVPTPGFPVAALTVASAEDGSPRVWAAGSTDEDYPQLATARWADGAWQRLDTPAYHFPEPVPPEAAAVLETIVHDPVSDRMWALGGHDFNHGEVEEEPDAETIVLTREGDAWRKVSIPDFGRGLTSSTTVPDGTGGLLLDSRMRRTKDGKVHKLRDPGRLPEPSEVPKPKRKYDFGQPFDVATTRLIPGTRTVLAVGGVTFNNSSDTGDAPQRPALARYDAS